MPSTSIDLTQENRQEYIQKELDFLETQTIEDLHLKEFFIKILRQPDDIFSQLDKEALQQYWEKHPDKRQIPNKMLEIKSKK